MKNVLVLAPRLDVPFKNLGTIPNNRGPISQIRVHWFNFIKGVIEEHQSRGDTVSILERPLWQFSPKDVYEISPDIVYIPHREKNNFPITKEIEPRYYMQTVFPERFTVDSSGWGGGMEALPIKPLKKETGEFKKLYKKIENNISKFDQPDKSHSFPWSDYILFVCQLPHDHTIKYHSNISVEDALKTTLNWCEKNNKKILVKGHPANPESMKPLRDIFKKSDFERKIWVEGVSIFDCLENANSLFCVNSGVGIEAMLFNLPIYIFGNSEYENVVSKIQNRNIDYVWSDLKRIKYHKWIDAYLQFTIDSSFKDEFKKLQ